MEVMPLVTTTFVVTNIHSNNSHHWSFYYEKRLHCIHRSRHNRLYGADLRSCRTGTRPRLLRVHAIFSKGRMGRTRRRGDFHRHHPGDLRSATRRGSIRRRNRSDWDHQSARDGSGVGSENWRTGTPCHRMARPTYRPLLRRTQKPRLGGVGSRKDRPSNRSIFFRYQIEMALG